MRFYTLMIVGVAMLSSCSAKENGDNGDSTQIVTESVAIPANLPTFSADSAFSYLKQQVEFGPRVPNSEAHRKAADWLAAELRRHGAEVTLQQASLKAFDGTQLNAVNIFGSFNPEATDRLLLLAHYDTRPWADKDSDPAKHSTPVDGANDGASGVAVLLETARILGANNPGYGIDILFVDAEDYGDYDNEDSWALGARYFAQNPIKPGYAPQRAILLDMVGGKNAVFPAEYFSRQAAPQLDDAFRASAAAMGHANLFPNVYGSGITDDHVELINAGIPAIDIIDYRHDTGFAPSWHTSDDNISNIDTDVLKAVGETLIHYIYSK